MAVFDGYGPADAVRIVEVERPAPGPGEVLVLVSGFSPFAHLVEALTDLDARHNRGVVVVGMNPTAPAREYLRPKLRTRYEPTASS